MKDFKDVSRNNWECFEKQYDEFTIIVERHLDDPKFSVFIDIGGDVDAALAKNVSLHWVSQLEKLLDDTF